jgi:hypothetical protein
MVSQQADTPFQMCKIVANCNCPVTQWLAADNTQLPTSDLHHYTMALPQHLALGDITQIAWSIRLR